MGFLTAYLLFATSVAIWAHLYVTYPVVQELKDEEILDSMLKRISCYAFSFCGNMIIAPLLLVVILGHPRKLESMKRAFKSGLTQN